MVLLKKKPAFPVKSTPRIWLTHTHNSSVCITKNVFLIQAKVGGKMGFQVKRKILAADQSGCQVKIYVTYVCFRCENRHQE